MNFKQLIGWLILLIFSSGIFVFEFFTYGPKTIAGFVIMVVCAGVIVLGVKLIVEDEKN